MNADPARETEVRILWSRDALYLRFRARYHDLHLVPTKNQRQEKLWLSDVAEVFLAPPSESKVRYREFEVSPNGDWFAIGIVSLHPWKTLEVQCEINTKGEVEDANHTWMAELAIPMSCLSTHFDPASSWRVNFFRIEGEPEERGSKKLTRFYSAWQATNTALPWFHVPEAFGELKFAAK